MSQKSLKLQIEYLPTKKLIPYARNSNDHDEDQIQKLAASISQFGFVVPVLIGSDHTIVKGHGCVMAAERLKLKTVPCVRLDHLSEKERRAYTHLDNRLAELSSTNRQVLLDDLKDLSGQFDEALNVEELFELNAPILYSIKRVAIDLLKRHPRNYREHPPDQLEHLCQSIREFGLYRNVITARDHTILAGHGLVLACKKLGHKTMPILELDLAPDDPKALKLLTLDNEIDHLGMVDDRALTQMLKEILDTEGLLGTGYDETMLANLIYVTRPASEIADKSHAEHWVGMPDYDERAEEFQVRVLFESEADRDAFLELAGIKTIHNKHKNKWATWWPERKMESRSEIKFE